MTTNNATRDIETDVCESHQDCQLPEETYDDVVDGEEYACDVCGRVYEYENGWFTPTDRHIDTGTEQ